MKYKYYLFDLDGTLTDPGIGITNSVMYALDKYGIHVDDRAELYPQPCFALLILLWGEQIAGGLLSSSDKI